MNVETESSTKPPMALIHSVCGRGSPLCVLLQVVPRLVPSPSNGPFLTSVFSSPTDSSPGAPCDYEFPVRLLLLTCDYEFPVRLLVVCACWSIHLFQEESEEQKKKDKRTGDTRHSSFRQKSPRKCRDRIGIDSILNVRRF